MMQITRKDRETVAKLLALAGSTAHDAETVSAVRKADALVKAAGGTWADVLLVRPVYIQPQLSRHRHPAEPEHVILATDLLRRGRGIINTWERNFLTGLLGYRELRPRQLELLSLISRKVAVARDCAA